MASGELGQYMTDSPLIFAKHQDLLFGWADIKQNKWKMWKGTLASTLAGNENKNCFDWEMNMG